MGAEAGVARLPVVPQRIQVESHAQNKRSCSGWGRCSYGVRAKGHWEQPGTGNGTLWGDPGSTPDCPSKCHHREPNRAEVKTEELKKPKVFLKPSESELPLLFVIWVSAPSISIPVTPVSPSWGLTCISQPTVLIAHNIPTLSAHTGNNPAHNVSTWPLHTVLGDSRHKPPTTPEDGQEHERCSGCWTLYSSSLQLSSTDALSSPLPFPWGDELPQGLQLPAVLSKSPLPPRQGLPSQTDPTNTSKEGLNVQNG